MWVHQDDLHTLIVDGEQLTTTEDHLFWDATDRRWERADELDNGDLLQTPVGDTARVNGFAWQTLHIAAAYNLTVENLHTYYVVVGTMPVLVHNDNGIPSVDNPRLQNIVNALFHGVGNPNKVGDGSAMAAANSEALGGAQVEGRNHLGSTAMLRSSLVNFLTRDTIRERGGKKVPVVRSDRDIQVANSLISAIDDAHAGKYTGLGNYGGLGGC